MEYNIPVRRGRVSFKHMAGQALLAKCMKQNKLTRGGCCCNCAHHLIDRSHPLTDGKACTKRRGWICAAPELGIRADGDGTATVSATSSGLAVVTTAGRVYNHEGPL